jgi:hypothetical protein
MRPRSEAPIHSVPASRSAMKWQIGRFGASYPGGEKGFGMGPLAYLVAISTGSTRMGPVSLAR